MQNMKVRLENLSDFLLDKFDCILEDFRSSQNKITCTTLTTSYRKFQGFIWARIRVSTLLSYNFDCKSLMNSDLVRLYPECRK
jgi:hypothetical protein